MLTMSALREGAIQPVPVRISCGCLARLIKVSRCAGNGGFSKWGTRIGNRAHIRITKRGWWCPEGWRIALKKIHGMQAKDGHKISKFLEGAMWGLASSWLPPGHVGQCEIWGGDMYRRASS